MSYITRVPPYGEKSKIVIVDYYSSKEGFWCTEFTTKNLGLLQSTDSEKIRKKLPKLLFFSLKLCKFRSLSWFFRNWTLQRVKVFLHCIKCTKTLLLSYINKQFNNFLIFYNKGGDFWFWMSRKLTTPLKMAENWKQVFLWTELQMDRESRWYSMFKRLDQNKNHPKV